MKRCCPDDGFRLRYRFRSNNHSTLAIADYHSRLGKTEAHASFCSRCSDNSSFFIHHSSFNLFHQLPVLYSCRFLASEAFEFVFLIFRVGTFEEEHVGITLESKDVGADAVEEPTVVADNNGKSRPNLLRVHGACSRRCRWLARRARAHCPLP